MRKAGVSWPAAWGFVAALLLAAGCAEHVPVAEPTKASPPVATEVKPPPPPLSPAPAPPAPATIKPPRFEHPPVIRIWLADASPAPEISCLKPCRIQPVGGMGRNLLKLGPVKARLAPGGLQLGKEIYKCAAMEFQANAEGGLKIDGRCYYGAIRLVRAGESLAVINVVDLEQYLLGVLGSEMPHDWPRESLKAQAVAARTYALFQHLQRSGFEWDLMSTVEDQVYGGGRAKPPVAAAVAATRGEVLVHDGGLFPAFFHSTCGGQTERPGKALGKSEYDFLEGVPCEWCKASPYYEWRAFLGASDLAAKLSAAGVAAGRITGLTAEGAVPARQTEGGQAGGRGVRLVWAGGEMEVPIVDFRRAVGQMTIRSGKFECRAQNGGFLFIGRGFGHGAGMCQYGCKGMAEAGYDYRRILDYYYRNAELEKLY